MAWSSIRRLFDDIQMVTREKREHSWCLGVVPRYGASSGWTSVDINLVVLFNKS